MGTDECGTKKRKHRYEHEKIVMIKDIPNNIISMLKPKKLPMICPRFRINGISDICFAIRIENKSAYRIYKHLTILMCERHIRIHINF
jgi:hypothetical protein